MIAGEVDAYGQATVRLLILGPFGREREIDGIIDTGYTGSLSLSSGLVAALELPFHSRGRAFLADGSESIFDVHEAVVMWDGVRRRELVDVMEADPLIGTDLLPGHELAIRMMAGGPVRIAAIKPQDR